VCVIGRGTLAEFKVIIFMLTLFVLSYLL